MRMSALWGPKSLDPRRRLVCAGRPQSPVGSGVCLAARFPRVRGRTPLGAARMVRPCASSSQPAQWITSGGSPLTSRRRRD